MKKILLTAVIYACFAIPANAQKIASSKVPGLVKQSFAKMYPGCTASWENEKGQFEAGFKQKGKNMSALFSADGTQVESETTISLKELPAAVLPYIKIHYKGVPIKEAAKITKADGSIFFEAEVNKTDVLFDEKGNFLKEVKG